MSTQICVKIYKNKICQKTINATPINFSNLSNNLHAHDLKKKYGIPGIIPRYMQCNSI